MKKFMPYLIYILGTVIVLLFAIYVYPTRYMYLDTRLGEMPVRVDRITGQTEVLRWDNGWMVRSE